MHRRRNGDLRMADHRDLIARHHGQAQRAGLGLGRRGAGGHDPARAARDQFAGGGDHLVQRAQLAADQQLQLEMIGRHAVGMRHQQVAVLRDQALVHVQPVVAVAHDRIDMHLDVGPGGAQRRQPARQRPPGPAGPGSRRPRPAPRASRPGLPDPATGRRTNPWARPRRAASDSAACCSGSRWARPARASRPCGTPAWRRCCRRSHRRPGIDGNDVHLDGGGGQRCAWRWGSGSCGHAASSSGNG